jgi:hypothetical protein
LATAASATELSDMPKEVIHTILTQLDDDMRAVLRLAQTSHWFAASTDAPLVRVARRLTPSAVAEAAAGPLGCGGRGTARQPIVP